MVEHGKVKPSYLGTKRCVVATESFDINGISVQMYSGTMEFPSSELVDCVKIRFLSVKERIFALLRSICFVGKQTIINSVKNTAEYEHSDRLHVPQPIQ